MASHVTRLNLIKRAIRSNVHEKTYGLLKSYGLYLSKKEHILLIRYVKKNAKYSVPVIRYLFYESPCCREMCALIQDVFCDACKYGFADVVRLLLTDDRVDPSIFYNEPVQLASEYGHADVVQILLEDSRVDPAYICNAALQYACENSHLDVIRILLADSRTDPSAQCYASIEKACKAWQIGKGSRLIVQLLVYDHRIDIMALYSNFKERRTVYRDLLSVIYEDERFNPNCFDGYALQSACYFNDIDLCYLLLNHPNFSIKEHTMRKHIKLACRCESTHILQMLMGDERFRCILFDDAFLLKAALIEDCYSAFEWILDEYAPSQFVSSILLKIARDIGYRKKYIDLLLSKTIISV